jgi:hypothetical protein
VSRSQEERSTGRGPRLATRRRAAAQCHAPAHAVRQVAAHARDASSRPRRARCHLLKPSQARSSPFLFPELRNREVRCRCPLASPPSQPSCTRTSTVGRSYSLPWVSSTPPRHRWPARPSRHRPLVDAAGAQGAPRRQPTTTLSPVRSPPSNTRARLDTTQATSSGEVRSSPARNSAAGEVQSALGTALQGFDSR